MTVFRRVSSPSSMHTGEAEAVEHQLQCLGKGRLRVWLLHRVGFSWHRQLVETPGSSKALFSPKLIIIPTLTLTLIQNSFSHFFINDKGRELFRFPRTSFSTSRRVRSCWHMTKHVLVPVIWDHGQYKNIFVCERKNYQI